MAHRSDRQRSAEGSRPRAERERRRLRAHAAAAAMFGLESRHRAEFAATFPNCQTPEFVELMIGVARDALATDPAAAVDRLVLGLGAAQSTNAAERDGMATARALATAELANAYRLRGELKLAECSLNDAARLVEALEDPQMRTMIDGHRIMLLCAQGKNNPMHRLVADALRTASDVPEHARGRLLLIIAVSLEPQPASVQALDRLEAGLRLIDPLREPRLVGVGLQGLGYRLIRLGKPEDGRYFLRRALAAGGRVATPIDRARSLWAASWADWMEGFHDSAIDKLQISAHRLTSLGQPIVAGTVLLDLSRALACRGRWIQAEQAAMKAKEILAACDSPRDLSIAEAVLRETGLASRRSARRVEEAVEELL